jgi:hypothetical protein
MTCAEACQPAQHGGRDIDGGDRHAWRHELEVETSPRTDDEHAIAIFQAKSFNRVTPVIRETHRADESIVDGSPNGIAKTIPHHSSWTR